MAGADSDFALRGRQPLSLRVVTQHIKEQIRCRCEGASGGDVVVVHNLALAPVSGKQAGHIG